MWPIRSTPCSLTIQLLNDKPLTYLVIVGEDVVHVGHILGGDLFDDKSTVIGIEQQTFNLDIHTERGTSSQRHLKMVKERAVTLDKGCLCVYINLFFKSTILPWPDRLYDLALLYNQSVSLRHCKYLAL